jgi:hypothetical protein
MEARQPIMIAPQDAHQHLPTRHILTAD